MCPKPRSTQERHHPLSLLSPHTSCVSSGQDDPQPNARHSWTAPGSLLGLVQGERAKALPRDGLCRSFDDSLLGSDGSSAPLSYCSEGSAPARPSVFPAGLSPTPGIADWLPPSFSLQTCQNSTHMWQSLPEFHLETVPSTPPVLFFPGGEPHYSPLFTYLSAALPTTAASCCLQRCWVPPPRSSPSPSLCASPEEILPVICVCLVS